MRNIIGFGNQKLEYYKDILIKANKGLHEDIFVQISKVLPRGSKILDFGCGEGALSLRLKDNGYDVVAVDMNKEDFKPSNIEFIQLDFNNSIAVKEFTDKYREKFDLVLGIEVIEHLHNPWAYIANLKEFVKPNGFILVTTPNITSWLSRLKFLFTGVLHSFSDHDVRTSGHITPIHESLLKLIFNYENVELCTIKSVGTLPKIWLAFSPVHTTYNILSLILRPFVKGRYDGYCILALGKKL